MRRMMAVRVLTVGALMVPATLGTLALANPAGAMVYTSCSSLSGLNLSGQTDYLSGCNGPTGGSGTFSGALTSPMTISWAGGGTTTIYFKTKSVHKSKCSAGSLEMPLSGRAKHSTGPATKIKGMFFANVCIGPTDNLSLLPGKAMLFQS